MSIDLTDDDDNQFMQVKCEAAPQQLLQVKSEARLQVKAEDGLQPQISDPRRAKRQRLNSTAAPLPPPPAAAGVSDLTSMLMSSLQRVAAPAPAAVPAQGPEVNQLLLSSLQALSASSANPLQNSLLSAVQQLHAPNPQAASLLQPWMLGGFAPVKQEMMLGAVKQEAMRGSVKQELGSVKQEYQYPTIKSAKAVKQELGATQYPTEVMSAADLAAFEPVEITRLPNVHRKAPPPERAPRGLDDDSDDDGVPHRLPPGFGAIPEEIIAERQAARDEERMRAIKSTQPCRFGLTCKKRDCPNMHPEGRNIDTTMNPCAFGRRCKRSNCFYDHPEGRMLDDDPTRGVCKLGKRCKRPDCLYTHPEGRDVPTGAVNLCFFCHEMGHIAQECPRNPASMTFNRTADRERQLMAAIGDGSAQ